MKSPMAQLNSRGKFWGGNSGDEKQFPELGVNKRLEGGGAIIKRKNIRNERTLNCHMCCSSAPATEQYGATVEVCYSSSCSNIFSFLTKRRCLAGILPVVNIIQLRKLSQHFTVKDRNLKKNKNTWVRENEKNIVPLLMSRLWWTVFILNIPRASTTPSAHNFPVITQHTQVLLGTEISLKFFYFILEIPWESTCLTIRQFYTQSKKSIKAVGN